MLNARVIFKKETKEAMNKPLGVIEKRKLRLEKLKELDEGGYLASATNRSDVGEMVGLPDKQQAYDWSTREIERGGLKEILVGFGNSGKPIYEYHYEPKPVAKKLEKRKYKMSSKDMFEKLKELEKSGELVKAECRSDLVRLLGFRDKNIGYTWIVNWIRRGHLQETELGRDGNGRVIANYKLTGSEPVWRTFGADKKKSGKKTERAPEPPVMKVYDKEQIKADAPTIIMPIKIEITRGDTTIKVEMGDYEKVSELVKAVLKGE